MGESFNEIFERKEEVVSVNQPLQPTDASSQIHDSVINYDFIFCSECGKKIKSDSKFCRHCGAKVDEDVQSSNSIVSANTSEQRIDTSAKPIEIKIQHESSIKKSTIADEILSNLKMIGIALIIWFVYIIGFMCYRSKDAAPLTYTNSYFGESCYDGIMTCNWEFSWEKHLIKKIRYMPNKNNKHSLPDYNSILSDHLRLSNLTPSQTFEEAKRQAKLKNIDDESFDQLTQEAKEAAKRDKESFQQEVSDIRKNRFEKELHTNMKWAAIIALAIMILGRYIILSCKWVYRNKS